MNESLMNSKELLEVNAGCDVVVLGELPRDGSRYLLLFPAKTLLIVSFIYNRRHLVVYPECFCVISTCFVVIL